MLKFGSLFWIQKREAEALSIIKRIHLLEVLEYEIQELKKYVEQEIELHGPSQKIHFSQLWKVQEVRYALIASCEIQVRRDQSCFLFHNFYKYLWVITIA